MQHNPTARFYKSHRKYPALFGDQFREEWLHPDMKEILKAFQASDKDDPQEVIPSLLMREMPDVYSFQCVSPEFIKIFNEEIDNFYSVSEQYNLKIRRPNSMNNYGVVVNEIGMYDMITHFQTHFLLPITRRLFPKQGAIFHDHHAFIVRYNANEDKGLDMHTDDSDVTLNICLGHNFTGATLQFCGTIAASDHRKHQCTYHHRTGRAVLHLGTRRHGAENIESGTRVNLVIWNHNHEWRGTEEYAGYRRAGAYATEEGPPDEVCLSFTHDRDYQAFKTLPEAARRRVLRPWCPPVEAEYPNFTTEPGSKMKDDTHEL